MEASEVAEAVVFILTRPRTVTIHDVIVLPTNIDA
jgi:ribitol 2-dehydrogenase